MNILSSSSLKLEKNQIKICTNILSSSYYIYILSPGSMLYFNPINYFYRPAHYYLLAHRKKIIFLIAK